MLGFFGFVNVYALRVNMSVAIVCMVNQTRGNETISGQCGLVEAQTSNNSNVTNVPDLQVMELFMYVVMFHLIIFSS